MEFNQIIENVQGWSTARGLNEADPVKQMQKLNEEWGELNQGKAKGDVAQIKDSIGDVLVVLTILSQQMRFEKIERLINPSASGFNHYEQNEVSTDLLVLYGSKEIGLIANNMLKLIYNPGTINTHTEIQFHIRNFTGILKRLAMNEGMTIENCFETAWNEIKDRKGKLIDGVWVKADDLEGVADDK